VDSEQGPCVQRRLGTAVRLTHEYFRKNRESLWIYGPGRFPRCPSSDHMEGSQTVTMATPSVAQGRLRGARGMQHAAGG
jgi:hypothetical protein